jgi:putative hydrolase of the HAD superfamily
MSLVQDKESFIFDLYGTLIDISTDELDYSLWSWLSTMYNDVGCGCTPEGIRDAYHRLVRKREEKLSDAYHTKYPEIELRDVFTDLLEDHQPEEDVKSWIENIALCFRLRSRIHFQAYPDSIPVLKELHKMGKRVFLLSNAQNCFTVPELEEAKLSSLFDGIYISSDYGYKKPAPEFMGQLLKDFEIRPEDAVMIGNDYSTDVLSGVWYHMDTVFLNTDGYRKAERKKRLKKVEECLGRAVEPFVVESGRLLELFDL